MKKRIKRIILDALGWFFVFFGIIGIFLPFLQGIFLIIIGLYILSLHSVWAHKKVHAFKLRYPKVGGRIDAFDHRVRSLLGIEQL